MTIVLDTRQHATAIKAAIKAKLGPNDAYDYDDVPGTNGNAGTVPNIFALVAVERRYNETGLLSANAIVGDWRVSVRGIGRTVDEARWVLLKVSDALNEQRLSIGGTTTTPIQFESDQAPAEDDDRFGGWSTWTYSAA